MTVIRLHPEDRVLVLVIVMSYLLKDTRYAFVVLSGALVFMLLSALISVVKEAREEEEEEEEEEERQEP